MEKILFLTSSPFTVPGGALNNANGFVDKLKRAAEKYKRALFVTAFPDDIAETKCFAEGIKGAAHDSGIEFDTYNILDRQNELQAAELVAKSDFLILGGGHVPTQAAFFEKIRLRELLEDFSGVIFGISAGSMNSATLVYAQPELDGEVLDPSYRRFIPGLGLTDYMLIPHYNKIKDSVLDGKRIFEDVTYPDSIGREFFAICDGSYLYSVNGEEQLFGECYKISDGIITRIRGEN